MQLNYFNFKRFDNLILLTNDAGKFAFVSPAEMKKLMTKKLTPDETCYAKLRDAFFLTDQPIEVVAAEMRDYIRDNKAYLFSGPSLHIFVLTNQCNMQCVYCQAQDAGSTSHGKMSVEIAEKAADIALSSPGNHLVFEFQGGEPLLNFDVLKHIVLYAESKKEKKRIQYTVASNLLCISNDMLAFFSQYHISISTSLDGNAVLHDSNRRTYSGDGTFAFVTSGIQRVRNAGVDIGAIQTTTRKTLNMGKEMIDAYIALGFESIFIRPLTPLGLAQDKWLDIGYSADEFLRFYENTLTYMIQKNRDGYYIREGHAALFLKKILHGYSENYMELRSPCGAALGQIAYYYDGEIYTCDEGRMLSEMGDSAFRIGSVYSSSYDNILNSKVCKATCAASVLESAPTCASCVYQPYCGICPVIQYAQCGDIISKKPHDDRCRIYGGILDILFNLIKTEDEDVMLILHSWLN